MFRKELRIFFCVFFSSCVFEPAWIDYIVIKNKTSNEICFIFYKDSVITDKIVYNYVDKEFLNPDSLKRTYATFDRNKNIYFYFFDAKKLKERIEKKDTNGLVSNSFISKIKFTLGEVSSKDTFTLK